MATPNAIPPGLAQALDGTHPLVAIATDDEEQLRTELFNAVSVKMPYFSWTAVRGWCDARIGSDMVPGTEHAAAALAMIGAQTADEAIITVFYDCSSYLTDARTARALREAVVRMREVNGAIVLVDRERSLPPAVETEVYRYDIPAATDAEIEQAIRAAVRELKRTRTVTAEVRPSTLRAMVRSLRGLTARQVRRVARETAAEDSRLDDSDLERMMLLKRNALGDLGGVLEFVKAPTSMERIGGLARLKAWLKMRTIARTDEAEEFGVRPPRGVLLLGVQGSGKSLAAKAVATSWGVPLLRLDASALYDKFVGESERKLRDTLAQADRMAPAVLWIDEIEKGFASASSMSSDGGLSRRMFGTLLTWMQERTASTFLAATANDISALPPELLRKGRFDETFFLDLPGADARREILTIHLARRKRDPKLFDLDALCTVSEGFSGAEIEAAIESAVLTAFSEEKRAVTTKDVSNALAGSPPLSHVMREKVQELRAWAANRCTSAD